MASACAGDGGKEAGKEAEENDPLDDENGNHCIRPVFHTKLFKLIQNIVRTNKKSHLAT